jgi:uncharacterized protein (DUF433 family)
MQVSDYITIQPEILSGTPVFKGTRVPVASLFDHLEQGCPLDEFLKDFPSVSQSQAVGVLEIAARLVSARNLKDFYESAA